MATQPGVKWLVRDKKDPARTRSPNRNVNYVKQKFIIMSSQLTAISAVRRKLNPALSSRI